MHLILDFDGTITPVDTTDRILSRLAPPAWETIEREWTSGRITASRCMREQIALLDVSLAEIDAVLDAIPLSPGFVETIAWAEARRLPVTIVSDGVDYFIRRILSRHGLDRLDVVANRLVEGTASRWRLAQPFGRPGCGSGVCKCMTVEALAGDETIVFVGDGRSDFCVSAKADLLFATGRLQAHCRAEDISFIPFTHFTDVLAALRRIHDLPLRVPAEPAFALGL